MPDTSLDRNPRWLAPLVGLAVVSLTAGSLVGLPLAGRTLPLGFTEVCVGLLVITTPLWFRRLPPLSTFTVAAGAFVLWAWLSVAFWSLDYRRSVLTSVTLLQAVVVFVAGWQVARREGGQPFVTTVRVMNVILVAQVAWALWRTFLDLQSLAFYTLKGGVLIPLGGSNYIAVFLEFGLLFELLARRRGWVVLAGLNALGIVLTLSRGAVVATAVALVLTGIAVMGVRGQRRVAMIVVGTAMLGVSLLVFTTVGGILRDAFAIVGRTASSRMSLWQDAWTAASWHPVTGVGFGAFEAVGTMRNAHSTLFELLAETGVVGLALFTIALGSGIVSALAAGASVRTGARQAEALGVAGGLGVVLIHSMIEPFFLGTSAVWTAGVMAWIMGSWSVRNDGRTVPAAADGGALPAPT